MKITDKSAQKLTQYGLMVGTSTTTVAADVTTSQAMVATILLRMADSPMVNYAMTTPM